MLGGGRISDEIISVNKSSVVGQPKRQLPCANFTWNNNIQWQEAINYQPAQTYDSALATLIRACWEIREHSHCSQGHSVWEGQAGRLRAESGLCHWVLGSAWRAPGSSFPVPSAWLPSAVSVL